MSTEFRSEPPHVAQQSRRDKLRVQPIAADHLLQVRDVYDPAVFSSAASVLDFSAAHGGHGFGNPSSSAAAGGGCDWTGGSLLTSHLYHTRPCVSGFQNAPQPSELASQDPHGLQFSSSPYAHNALQEVVASSSSNQGLGMAASLGHPWSDGGNRLLLLPGYANDGGTGRIDNTSVWMSRQPQQWSGEGEYSSATQQGLSLSLAPKPPPPEFHVPQFEERFGHEHLSISQGFHSSQVANEVAVAAPYAKFNAIHGVTGPSMDVHRSAGPLGPFTGYATILKSSKFLKPAQQLLVEFCGAVTGVAASASASVAENDTGQRGVNSTASSSSLQCLAEGSGGSGSGNGSCQVLRPEFQQKKAKLLLMQEEVCRRYKQYHQQMQMVVSAFESVAGLSAATPYTSLALKSVSKHFRCIKNAIADQIRNISKVLGEELMSSPSTSKGDIIPTSRLKYIEQNLRKPGDNSRFTDHNPPVWRPQRGLPERSVAVLRAWLFEHFLHPYPTDTDKHMLATQTGLSRNQVSNWFINARVRLWKPMVEEIHMLETKGMAEMNLNSADKNDGKIITNDDQRSEAQSSKAQSECSSMASVPINGSYQNLEQWHREKRSRMECMAPGSMNGGLMGFYRDGMDISGLGAVSLTLGLRHDEGAAGSHQQQPQHIPRHFGNQMVHDFVG